MKNLHYVPLILHRADRRITEVSELLVGSTVHGKTRKCSTQALSTGRFLW